MYGVAEILSVLTYLLSIYFQPFVLTLFLTVAVLMLIYLDYSKDKEFLTTLGKTSTVLELLERNDKIEILRFLREYEEEVNHICHEEDGIRRTYIDGTLMLIQHLRNVVEIMQRLDSVERKLDEVHGVVVLMENMK